jgi:hypothetical protein
MVYADIALGWPGPEEPREKPKHPSAGGHDPCLTIK